MRLADYDIDTRYDATLISSERLTAGDSPDEVRELRLRITSSELELDVGNSLGVLVPGPHEFGQPWHLRLYTVADLPRRENGGLEVALCVKRCTYIDTYTGERHDGVASNYLCDRRVGDQITLTGPYGLPFAVPPEHDARLVLVGMGTGIAPFRALIKHLYQRTPDWTGPVTLIHGARSGLELIYRNDEKDDFAQYYDRDTFEAIEALSARPDWTDDIAWEKAIESRSEEIWRWLGEPSTYVYVAGLERIGHQLDCVFGAIAGGEAKWRRRKAELEAGGRWVELLY